MSYEYPDQIKITPVIRDQSFRSEIKGTPYYSDAQIEVEDRIQYDTNGQPLDPRVLVLLPAKTIIKKGDIVNIIKLHGASYSVTFDYHVISAFPVGSVAESHIEVIL